jgi:GxxExxY protein
MLSRAASTLPADTENLGTTCIACAIEVHRRLGPGFLEGVYQDAMAIELEESGLAAQREVPVTITYRGRPLRQYRVDLIVENRVILELKAVERFDRIHQAQLISYLRATGIRLGLLMDFNNEYLKTGLRRIVM